MVDVNTSRYPLRLLKLSNFTAFEDVELDISAPINVLVGANGTGKTHILKVLYSACVASQEKNPREFSFERKLVENFLPDKSSISRLVRRKRGGGLCSIEIQSSVGRLKSRFSSKAHDVTSFSSNMRNTEQLEAAYIPVKEMLANAPGFLSTFRHRELHFEGVYADIITKAYLPPIKGRPDAQREKLLDILKKPLGGTVTQKGEVFYLDGGKKGTLEFSLVAEGIRKLCLLWLLIQNGTFSKGSVLFWDEPEANLNPSLIRVIVSVLFKLQKVGVQIYVATHDYTVLKWFHLLQEKAGSVRYHALGRVDKEVVINSTDDYFRIKPNTIAETFDILYDEAIKKERGIINK